MSVIARIIGENDGSDEYAAAERLKQIIDTTIPKTAMGEIIDMAVQGYGWIAVA